MVPATVHRRWADLIWAKPTLHRGLAWTEIKQPRERTGGQVYIFSPFFLWQDSGGKPER